MVPSFVEIIDSLFNPLHYHFYEHNLHYQHEPVGGIYYTDTSNRRFLVAIKSNGKPDTDHSFKSKIPYPKSREGPRLESPYRGVTWASTTTLTDSTKSALLATKKLSTHSSDRSIKLVIQENENTTIRSKHDRKPSTLRQVATQYLPLLFINNLTSYLGRERSITCEDNFGGYRNLTTRLEVVYSTILNRWMFVSEIRARTKSFLMCGSEKCLAVRHTHCKWQCAKACGSDKCGKLVDREMFMLDDGKTYVIVGDVKESKLYGREVANRDGVTLKKSALFVGTLWGGLMRLKPNDWCRKRRELFALGTEGGFRIMTGVEEDYVAVVEYLTGDEVVEDELQLDY